MTLRGSLASLGLALALVGVPGAAAAQPPGITRHLLPNGMTVIVRENAAAPVVTRTRRILELALVPLAEPRVAR